LGVSAFANDIVAESRFEFFVILASHILSSIGLSRLFEFGESVEYAPLIGIT
jgi:hypothetical protein